MKEFIQYLLNNAFFIGFGILCIGLSYIAYWEVRESRRLKKKINNFPKVRSFDERDIYR